MSTSEPSGPDEPATVAAPVVAPDVAPEHRWRRAVVRLARHLVRLNALRAFSGAVVALGVLTVVGADTPVGQDALYDVVNTSP